MNITASWLGVGWPLCGFINPLNDQPSDQALLSSQPIYKHPTLQKPILILIFILPH